MKSQVNSLLHVMQGILKDCLAAYPALEEGFTKDYGRLALYCQNRGIGFFTLDLPHLESQLLKGLESGSLRLEGPLSQRVSKRIQVPRLFSGLWLLVFDRYANLKQDVDVTALFFLRQLLVLGKKLELGCSDSRIQAAVGAYHDIERELRRPDFDWAGDSLCGRWLGGSCYDDSCQPVSLFDFPVSPVSTGLQEDGNEPAPPTVESVENPFRRLHLVQALDGSLESMNESFPLFANVGTHRTTDDQRQRISDQRLLSQIQRVADLIVGAFDTIDPVSYSADLEESGEGIGFRHGQGAVAERLKNWEKFQFPNWPHKLQHLFPFELCGKTAGSDEIRPSNHEVPSRLIDVPKTRKGPRLIAAESTAHMWCQQLLLRFFKDQFGKHFGGSFIDLQNQSKSSDLVYEASSSRELATVDLSDASDRLSCWTVERMFRLNPSVLYALHAARTRYLRDELSRDKGFLILRKFASQGTATTFPVMSLVMLIIALGSTLDGEISWTNIRKLRNRVRVYGDDIILPSRGYAKLARAMELLQLKVNMAKSYTTGYFRESCGTDGYRGYDITPVKPKTLVCDSPASCQAVVDITNNLFCKGLWHASDSCRALLPPRVQRGLRIVGYNDAGFSGLTSYSGSDESHLTTRENTRLHRYEVRVWTLLVRTRKRDREGYTTFLDFASRKHNPEFARIVSEYVDTRESRDGFTWEPLNSGARLHRDTA